MSNSFPQIEDQSCVKMMFEEVIEFCKDVDRREGICSSNGQYNLWCNNKMDNGLKVFINLGHELGNTHLLDQK